VDNRRSVTGLVFVYCGGPIAWSSKTQKCVALSTTEAELNALSEAAKHALYLRKHQRDFNLDSSTAIQVFSDNQSALALLAHGVPQYHGRMKHYDIKAHHLHEATKDGAIDLNYCATNDMLADILTKALPTVKIEYLRGLIGLSYTNAFA
jgi:hypothetical protein